MVTKKNQNNEYRKLKSAEYSKFEKYINTITSTAKFLDAHVVGKKFKYYTSSFCLEVQINSYNYAHLCGIKYSRGANNFYKSCKSNKININDISIKSDGSTFLKLQVLKQVSLLFEPGILLTKRGVFLNLKYDNMIRTRKRIIAMAFKDTGKTSVPISLLDLSVADSKEYIKGLPVIKLESFDLNTQVVTTLFDLDFI